MKIRAIASILFALFSAPFNFSQNDTPKPSPARDVAPLIGVWRGQMDTLPAVTLNITDEGGGLSGAVLFYLIKRSSVMSEPTTSTPGIPEPLFNVRFEGQLLVFEVSHRRAHPPKTLNDPPVRFHLTLTGPDKAELVNENENTGPGFPMIREK
jgi:hypothetical protein